MDHAGGGSAAPDEGSLFDRPEEGLYAKDQESGGYPPDRDEYGLGSAGTAGCQLADTQSELTQRVLIKIVIRNPKVI